ncbi:serine/threonine-protein kinase [Actinomadura rupiterrae]|uniref:serine/threonine-protein kinase n=1 Tax=Actinomadura rupiterrae TaxID=559627 RepID=UPI0020A4A238|nr:serine/threonine-protein kinase [Actinomadura rupiterrae]MCP2335104.1 serine/threonine protein kinase [Actinomadura rupiterrae]
MEPLRSGDPAEIGGYPVLARLGEGGMGVVYLGVSGGGRHVALKMVRDGLDDPQHLARFRREVATAERVRSRYAAAMVAAGLTAPPYWLATEYVPGLTLRQAVERRGPLPPRLCLGLLAALARGLAEIHGQGVQHRDLKPGNVILAPDGPRLIDFGIARGSDQTQITRTGAWAGTPGYVAPEVIREQAQTFAADVFSLAGTVAYAATGRPPFGGGPVEALLHRTLTGDIDVSGVEPRLAGLIRMCAEKDPDRRATLAQLIELTNDAVPLAADASYRGALDTGERLPRDRGEAVTMGLAPEIPRRSRLLLPMLAAGGVGAVAVAVALVVQFAPTGNDGHHGAANQGGAHSSGPSSNNPQGGTTPNGSGTPSSGTPSAPANPNGVPPDKITVQPADEHFKDLKWKDVNTGCLPTSRTEPGAPSDLQTSAPRSATDVKAGGTTTLSMRFKYQRPAKFYVAAQVRQPAQFVGSDSSGIVQSKPKLLTTTGEFVDFAFPGDFAWSGSGGNAALDKGSYTVVWLHVHPNGDAYYIGCDGFAVP